MHPRRAAKRTGAAGPKIFLTNPLLFHLVTVKMGKQPFVACNPVLLFLRVPVRLDNGLPEVSHNASPGVGAVGEDECSQEGETVGNRLQVDFLRVQGKL